MHTAFLTLSPRPAFHFLPLFSSCLIMCDKWWNIKLFSPPGCSPKGASTRTHVCKPCFAPVEHHHTAPFNHIRMHKYTNRGRRWRIWGMYSTCCYEGGLLKHLVNSSQRALLKKTITLYPPQHSEIEMEEEQTRVSMQSEAYTRVWKNIIYAKPLLQGSIFMRVLSVSTFCGELNCSDAKIGSNCSIKWWMSHQLH